MGFVRPTTSLSKKGETTNTDRYFYYFSCKIIRKKCPPVGWVRQKRFRVEISIERSHVIHMNLNDCIGFSESEHPYEHKSNTLNTVS